MDDFELSEIIKSIPNAFWKSFAFQQINKRKDLKTPRWSILVNETGVQCSLFWPGSGESGGEPVIDNVSSAKNDLLSLMKEVSSSVHHHVDHAKENIITPTEAPVGENAIQSDISDLIQNVLKRQISSLSGSDTGGTSGDIECDSNGAQPKKLRKKTTPIKTDYTRLPTHSLYSREDGKSPVSPISPAPTIKQEPFGPNEASKRLMELSSKHFQVQNSDDSTLIPGPFGNSLLNMAKAAQQNIEIGEIETISTSESVSDPPSSSSQHVTLPSSSMPLSVSFPTPNSQNLGSKDLSAEKIEKIAHDTGTYQTLQKMRNEAERGTLNLSKAVRLLARCLFNEDELVVESIKDLDQNKVDLLHAETARWYNCTMTEVRQVMSFRLSEIRKTKRASHWAKRTPFSTNQMGITYTDNNQFILPKITNQGSGLSNQDLIKQLTGALSQNNDSSSMVNLDTNSNGQNVVIQSSDKLMKK